MFFPKPNFTYCYLDKIYNSQVKYWCHNFTHMSILSTNKNHKILNYPQTNISRSFRATFVNQKAIILHFGGLTTKEIK